MTNANPTYSTTQYEPRPTLINELSAILSIVRRRIGLIILLIPAGLALGYAASFLVTPTYTAETQLSLDPRRVAIAQPVNAQTQRRDEPMIDSGRADSEAETIKSESVIRSVVTTLDLQNNLDFTAPRNGIRAKIMSLFVTPEVAPTNEEDRILLATAVVAQNLKVERVDKSYVFTITYGARDPLTAALVANGLAQLYIKKQLDADYDATREAVGWLKQRVSQLSDQAEKADQAAGAYQTQAKIARSDGKLIDEQQLETLSSQLSDATAQRVEAQARYDGAMQFSATSEGDLSTTASFQNDVISKLRSHYVALESQANSFAARYGETHTAVIKLRGDAKAVADSIKTELLRYQQSYKNDLDVAVAREKSIRDAMDGQITKAATTNEAQVQLNSLEDNAKSLHATYDGFMQRYTEAMQRQSFPVSEARVISEATAAAMPSKPKRVLFAAGGAIFGMLSGLAFAFALELSHRKIRTRSEAELAAGVECLGYFPKLNMKYATSGAQALSRGLPPDYVRLAPFSVGSETLRTVKATLDYRTKGEGCPVVGVASCFPNEGKTSISSNLSFLLASTRKRVLVIDGDVRNPGLSRLLRQIDNDSLRDHSIKLTENLTVIRHPELPFDFLPIALGSRESIQADGGSRPSLKGRAVTSLDSEHFRTIIDAARPLYDYVVVDLPPIILLSDVRVVADSISAFVLVLKWGHSEIAGVGDALDSIPGISDKLAGSVLNMADLKSLPKYGEHIASYYSSEYFTQ